jgi:type II secretory pathway component GspD/PulD (secretin)
MKLTIHQTGCQSNVINHNNGQGRSEINRTKPNPAMKKTCYTLLVALASLVVASAQTNDPQPAPPVEPTSVMTAEPAAAPVVIAETHDDAIPAAPPAPVAVGIPQIKFSDVPITTAIENLARLANINYMLDPRIGYGLPDANGQIKVEPTLSIRWENITAENALLALLDNYGLQLVTDKKTGIDKITVKDPTAPPPLFTKVVQLKYASVSNMIEAAQSVLTDKRSKVLTDPRTSQLVVVATDPEQQAVEILVNQLDKPTRQVLIETRLVEVTTNPKTKKGVDWTGTLQSQNVTFGNTLAGGVRYSTTGGFSPATGFLSADGLSVVMSFLNSSSEAQIMSTPRIVTLDNEAANISVTKGIPIFSVAAGTQNTAGGSSVSYSNVGTILHVTPRISANNNIWLRVVPEVSSQIGERSQAVDGGILTAPVFQYRTMETHVLIPNSNTLVLGGLVEDSPKADYTKVPLLGDIPGLGKLFSSEAKEVNKVNLLIFITPTIVKDTDFRTSKSGEYLMSKPQVMKDPLNPKTAWDGSQPNGAWSNPIPPIAE